MKPTTRQNLLALLLLLLATQLLLIGCERLFLLPDADLIQVYQQALPHGRELALQAAARVAGKNAELRLAMLPLHEGQGDMLALLLSCLVAGYFWWRNQASWLLPLLVLGMLMLPASGEAERLRSAVLTVLNSLFATYTLGGKLLATGITLSICFVLLVLLIGAKVLPVGSYKAVARQD